MSDSTTIVCKPSQWFKIRAIAVSAMLIFFSLWFFKDGYWGYRDKNEAVVMKQLFLGSKDSPTTNVDFALKAVDEFEKGEYTEETWAAFAKEQTIPVPSNKDLLPREFDYDQKWPEEIINGYEELKNDKPYELWKEYSSRTSFPIEPSEKLYEAGTIREQFIVCGVCVGLLLLAIFFSLRIMGRSMKVTSTGYSPPGGEEIPFSAMHKLDKRKWDGKGLATISYKEDGETKKAKVDGMVYGQFKEEDGAPAEALFTQIMDNFKGEVIEFVSEEDEEGDDEEESSEEKNKDLS